MHASRAAVRLERAADDVITPAQERLNPFERRSSLAAAGETGLDDGSPSELSLSAPAGGRGGTGTGGAGARAARSGAQAVRSLLRKALPKIVKTASEAAQVKPLTNDVRLAGRTRRRRPPGGGGGRAHTAPVPFRSRQRRAPGLLPQDVLMYNLMIAASLHPFAYDGETYSGFGTDSNAVPVVSELLVRPGGCAPIPPQTTGAAAAAAARMALFC